MIQKHLASLRKNLEEVLQLDWDVFGLETERQEIISRFIGLHLRSAFQPIHDAGKPGEPLGYEALLRPTLGTAPVSPLFAFSVADNHGKLVKMDRVARTLHTLNYLNLPDNKGLLFVNVHPDLLANVNAHGKVFERILQTHSVPTRQVVIEIMANAVKSDQPLIKAVSNYSACGYRIAIDNFGNKHSNFDRVWKLSPDFVKLDPSIIKRAQTNPRARSVLSKLIEIPQELGARSIVVGIENETQYKIAQDAGAKLLQGYFLGRPASASEWHKQRQSPRENPVMPGAPYHFGSFSAAATIGI